MKTVTASDARAEFTSLLEDAENGERVIIKRHGTARVALVSIQDLRFLEEVGDIKLARAAMKEKGLIPYEQVREELGLGKG